MIFINRTTLLVLITVILLHILLFMPKSILACDLQITGRNEKPSSADRLDPLKFQAKMDESLIILKYSPPEKSEELITADIRENVIDFQKKMTIRDITPFDRYFRFVNETNNFIFLRSHPTEHPMMNFERLNDKNKYGDTEVSLDSINLDSEKKNSRVFYDWDNYNCRKLGYISDRPPEFYIADRNGEIAVVNLYLSRFDGVIFLVNEHDFSNDFLGNITDRNLPDLPVNVQFKDDWRLASY